MLNKKGKIILFSTGFVLILTGVCMLLFYNPSSYSKKMEENPEINEMELSDEELDKLNKTKIGRQLYSKALEIYQIKPYCGIEYKLITSSKIITENNTKYYKTQYSNISQVNKLIENYFVTNPYEHNEDYITKNKTLYCKYTPLENTKNFLGDYSLELTSNSDTIVEFKVEEKHLSPTHSEGCSLDNSIDCLKEDMINSTSKFVIIKVDKDWKIQTFMNPYN